MNKHVICCFSSFLVLACFAQENLVPNSSFEGCEPNSGNQDGFFGAPGWFNPTIGTTDLFSNFEANSSCYMVNVNVALGEDPQGLSAYEGDQFVGMYAYHPDFCLREFVSCRLIEPLEVGVTYCVSFYVRTSFQMNNATDGIGIQLSPDSMVNFGSMCELNLTPSVQTTPENPVVDTQNWTYVSGEYIAEGGELYLILGNLLQDEALTIQPISGTTISPTAYYFYDNVSVVNCDNTNTIAEQKIELEVFPNPAHNTLNVQCSQPLESVKLFHIDGRLVAEMNPKQVTSLSLREVASGSYIVQLVTANGALVTKHIQVVK